MDLPGNVLGMSDESGRIIHMTGCRVAALFLHLASHLRLRQAVAERPNGPDINILEANNMPYNSASKGMTKIENL